MHWLSHPPAGSACELLADAALCGRGRTATSFTFASACLLMQAGVLDSGEGLAAERGQHAWKSAVLPPLWSLAALDSGVDGHDELTVTVAAPAERIELPSDALWKEGCVRALARSCTLSHVGAALAPSAGEACSASAAHKTRAASRTCALGTLLVLQSARHSH